MAYTGYSKYRFTENMAMLFQNKMSNLGNTYCREDYKRAIEAVRKAPKDKDYFK